MPTTFKIIKNNRFEVPMTQLGIYLGFNDFNWFICTHYDLTLGISCKNYVHCKIFQNLKTTQNSLKCQNLGHFGNFSLSDPSEWYFAIEKWVKLSKLTF